MSIIRFPEERRAENREPPAEPGVIVILPCIRWERHAEPPPAPQSEGRPA